MPLQLLIDNGANLPPAWLVNTGVFSVGKQGVTITSPNTQRATAIYQGLVSNNQFAQLRIVARPASSDGIGPAVRMSAGGGVGGGTYYGCDVFLTAGVGTMVLIKVIGGTVTTLASVGVTLAVGDVIRIEAAGTQLTCKLNGVTKITATDSAIAAGKFGMQGNGNNPASQTAKDFQAGNLGGLAGANIAVDPLLSEYDYVPYLVPGSLQIVDQINLATQVKFTLANINTLFQVPRQGAYFKVFSQKYQRFLATGFITAEPVRKLLGPSRSMPTTKFQAYTYDVIGASDEWLANVKSNPIIPAYVNQGKGQILANLLNALVPNFYATTVSTVASGDLVPFFQYDPSKTWTDVAKEFADTARYRYKVINKTLYFQPLGDASLGVKYDEDVQPQRDFDPYGLQSDVLVVPPVNDAIVIGDVEPQEYREDHFIGDGLTGDFGLHHEAFRAESALLLQEDWTNNTLSQDLWTEVDPFSTISLAAGALNVVSQKNLVGMNDFTQWAMFFTVDQDPAIVTLGNVRDPLNDMLVNRIHFPTTGVAQETGIQWDTGIVPTNGQQYDFAVWLRAPSSTSIQLRFVQSTGENSNTFSASVTTSWQRFNFSITISGAGAGTLLAQFRNPPVTSARDFFAWEAEVVLGGSQPREFQLNQSYMQAKNGVELGGTTLFQHGEFTFTDSGNGIVGGVYNSRTEFLNKECEFGFDVRPGTAVVSSASGASGMLIQPIRFGSRLGPVITTKLNHTYVLSNFVNCQKWARANTVFRSLAGSPFGGASLSASGSVTWTVQDYDIGNPSAAPVVTRFSLDLNSLPSFGVYVPINSANLNLFVNFTLISQPPQASLEVRSLYGPTGLMLPIGRPTTVPGSVGSPTVVAGSSATGTAVPYSISGICNRVGRYQDLTVFPSPGGVDLSTTTSATHSSAQVGNTVTFQGVTYVLAPVVNNSPVNNALEFQGQILNLLDQFLPEAPYASLRMLAIAVQGNKGGLPVSVRYTDGSVDAFTQSFSDWFTPQSYPGESTAIAATYRNLSDGTKDNRTFNLYSYAFNLNIAKSVRSIILPTVADVVVYAISLVPITITPSTVTPGAVASGTVAPGALDDEQKYVLGFGLQQQVATLQKQGDTTQLRFYPDTIPSVGARIRLRSRSAGAALGRVRDPVSIASTAATSGDDGVRGGIFSDLHPLPRTSEESELAAAALISDRAQTQFKGTYTFTDQFLQPSFAFIPAASGYVLDPQDLSTSNWFIPLESGFVTPRSSIAPDGTMTGNTVDDTDLFGATSLFQSVTPVPNDSRKHWVTCYVANSLGVTALLVQTDDGSEIGAFGIAFDPNTGQYSATDLADPPLAVAVAPAPNNWWRVAFQFPNPPGALSWSLLLYPAFAATLSGTGLAVITPNEPGRLGSAQFWGVRISLGSFDTPYLPQLQDYPLTGRFLFCNAPRRGIVNKSLLATGITTSVIEPREERLQFQVEFGPDLFLEKLLELFAPTDTAGVLLPQDTATRPSPQALASVGTTFLPDLSDAKVTNLGIRPINLLSYSEQFDQSVYWTPLATGAGTPPVVTPNFTAGPFGDSSADKIAFPSTGSGDSSRLGQKLTFPRAIVDPTKVTASIWLKTDSSGTVEFVLKNGTVIGGSEAANQNCSLTSQWKQFFITGNLGAFATDEAGSVSVQLRRGQSLGAINVYAWGAQLEDNPNFTIYQQTLAVPQITTGAFVVDTGYDPTASPLTWIEVRRVDGGWGSNDQNLIGIFTKRFIGLTRQVRDQTWYMRVVSASATSRFTKIVRINYPIPPSAPGTISSDSRFVQMDFAGDVRDIYGIELRAGDNATVLAQRPVFAKQDMYFDLQSLPFYSTVLAFGRTIYAYFFNLQWEYSPQAAVPLPAPPAPVLTLGNKFGSLVESRLDKLARTDINYTTYQVAQDVNFTVNVITVTGSQQPATMSVNVPNSSGSQFFARARRTDYFGDGPWSSTLNIPYGNIIASSWSVGQGSIPPTLDNQTAALFTYTSTALVGGGANSGRIVAVWPGFSIAFADQTVQAVASGAFDTNYTLATSTSAQTPYIFYPRIAAQLPGAQPQMVGSPAAHTSKSAIDAQQTYADGYMPLGGATYGITFNAPQAPSVPPPGTGGGGDGGGGCAWEEEHVITPQGKIKVKDVRLGQLLRGMDHQTNKLYWNSVARLQYSEELCVKISLADGSSLIVSRTTPIPVWDGDGKFIDCLHVKFLTGVYYLRTLAGELVRIAELADVGSHRVVMIGLAPSHLYFVNGVLTHNLQMEK